MVPRRAYLGGKIDVSILDGSKKDTVNGRILQFFYESYNFSKKKKKEMWFIKIFHTFCVLISLLIISLCISLFKKYCCQLSFWLLLQFFPNFLQLQIFQLPWSIISHYNHFLLGTFINNVDRNLRIFDPLPSSLTSWLRKQKLYCFNLGENSLPIACQRNLWMAPFGFLLQNRWHIINNLIKVISTFFVPNYSKKGLNAI